MNNVKPGLYHYDIWDGNKNYNVNANTEQSIVIYADETTSVSIDSIH